MLFTVKLLESIVIAEAPATAVKEETRLSSIVSKIPSLSSSKSQALFIPSASGSFAVGVPTVAPNVHGSSTIKVAGRISRIQVLLSCDTIT